LFRNIGLRLGLRTTSPFAASALHIKSESWISMDMYEESDDGEWKEGKWI
jgi:hypothetical protein